MKVKMNDCVIADAVFKVVFPQMFFKKIISKAPNPTDIENEFSIDMQYFLIPTEEEDKCTSLWILEIFPRKTTNIFADDWEKIKNIFFEKELIKNGITDKDLFNRQTFIKVIEAYNHLSIKENSVIGAIVIKKDKNLKEVEGFIGIFLTSNTNKNEKMRELFAFLKGTETEIEKLIVECFKLIKTTMTLANLEIFKKISDTLIYIERNKKN